MSPLSSSSMLDNVTVESRLSEWEQSYETLAPCDRWMLREACVGSLRLERAEAMEAGARSRVRNRAAAVWDDDRRLAAEELADRLPRKPVVIARRLRTSRHGCLLMAGRWKALRAIVASTGSWTEAQRSMAGDLLGIAPDFRDDDPRLDASNPAAILRTIDGEVRELEALADGPLVSLDRDERLAAESGVCVEHDGSMKIIRAFIARCRRQVEWCLKQIKSCRKSVAIARPESATPVADESDAPPAPAPAAQSFADGAHSLPPTPKLATPPSTNRRGRRAEKARRRGQG